MLPDPAKLTLVQLKVQYEEVSEQIDKLLEKEDRGVRVSRELHECYRWLDRASVKLGLDTETRS